MGEFKEYFKKVVISEEEHKEFVYICSDWEMYCNNLSTFNTIKVLKLLRYLVEERRGSEQLLKRAVGRFNRVNTLTMEGLLSCLKNR